MNMIRNIKTVFCRLPGNRDFWLSMGLFCWVAFTGFILVEEYETASRWRVFRWVVQMVLFLVWGIERFKKYKSEMKRLPSP